MADVLSDIDAALAAPPPPAGAPAAAAFPAIVSDIDSAMAAKPTAMGPQVGSPVGPTKDVGMFTGAARGILDSLQAGQQGTSPIVAGLTGYNYSMAPPEEQAFFAETGFPRDATKQVALRDPASGEYRVFLRNPEMAEGALPAMGRVLALATPDASIPRVASAVVPNAAQNLLQDFERVGVAPNAPLVGQNKATGVATNLLTALPLASEKVRSGIGQTIGQTASAAERIAADMGDAATPEEAGNIVQAGVRAFNKGDAPVGATPGEIIAAPTRESGFGAKSGALYDRFSNMMPQDSQTPVSSTLEALGGPAGRFPSSPELGAMMTNPKFQAFKSAIEEAGGSLTFPELQEFRSYVGRMLGDAQAVDSVPRADLKRLYGAISDDLKAAATAQGPEALKAFNRANQYYRAGVNRIDQLEPLLSGAPEKSFAAINRAASDGAGANAGLLRSLQRSMEPEDWREVGATVLRRMGQPPAGAADVLGHVDFSPSSFVTNWNRLSDAAKDTLFGANTAGSTREALESLTRVAQSQKNLGRLANASHSGEIGVLGMAGMAAWEHMDEMLAHPIMTTAAVLGPRMFASALMSPGFARWLYQAPKMIGSQSTTAAGVDRAIGALDMMARQSPTLAPAAQQLRNAFAAPGQQPSEPPPAIAP